MKNINIKTALNAWHNTWENTKNLNCYDTYFSKFIRTLRKKYFAGVYDENDNCYFGIFDNKRERYDWLINWIEKHPNVDGSGRTIYQNFKKFARCDINSLCAYKPIDGYNGVLFSL